MKITLPKLGELEHKYHINIGSDEQRNRQIEFTGMGFYSLDRHGVYRKGRFRTTSVIFISDRR